MLRRGMGCLLVLAALLCTGRSWAQTKMTIATGVDPVFSAYYVAQQEGLFKKHELDVRINTGPSGSAMVAFLVNGQIESAFGSEIAGVANHNLDPNVVIVAQATRLVRWIAVVGGNIDAYAVWEPWVTRGLGAVKNTKVLRDQEGILEQGVYIYMNRGWIQKNPAPAEAFIRALVDATDLINHDRKRAARDVSDFLKNLDPATVEQLMAKLTFEMELSDFTVNLFRLAEAQLKAQGKLAKPLDWSGFIYPDLMRKVLPEKVNSKP